MIECGIKRDMIFCCRKCSGGLDRGINGRWGGVSKDGGGAFIFIYFFIFKWEKDVGGRGAWGINSRIGRMIMLFVSLWLTM